MNAIRAAVALPELLRHVGGHRRQHEQQLFHAFAPSSAVDGGGGPDPVQMVGQLHQRSHGGVELEPVQVVVTLAHRLMQQPGGVADSVFVHVSAGQMLRVPDGDVPHPVKPTGGSVDADIAPGPSLVPRADEHQEAAHRVGAQLADHVVGIHDVAPALAHLLVVFSQDDALVEQPQERFFEIDQPHVMEGLDEEPGIEQVHDGVFSAAGVLVHRQPPFRRLRIHRTIAVVRAQVAHHVPRRVHERVHGVGFPPSRTAAPGARGVDESGVGRQGRFAGGFEFSIFRQQHRQVFRRYGHNLAVGAIDDRDGRPPVPLPGDEPVPQPVRNGPFTPAVSLDVVGDGLDALFVGHSLVPSRVGHETVAQVGFHGFAAIPGDWRYHGPHRQPVLLGEFKVPRVMGRDAHDRSGAVGHQHVVADVYGHPLVVQPVHGVAASEHSGLFLLRGKPVDFRGPAGLLNVLLHLLPASVGSQTFHQGVFRG